MLMVDNFKTQNRNNTVLNKNSELVNQKNGLLRPLISKHLRRRILPRMLADYLITVFAFVTAYLIRHSFSELLVDERMLTFIGLSSLLIITSLYLGGIYHRVWSKTSGRTIFVILKALQIPIIVLTVVNLVTPYMHVIALFVANILNVLLIVGVRYRYRLITGLVWRWNVISLQDTGPDKLPERMLIIGAGESGQSLATRLDDTRKNHNIFVVGFVDDDSNKIGLLIENLPVLGNTSQISEIVNLYNIDVIAVAIHNITGSKFREILETCETTSARIRVVPDIVASLSQTHTTELLRDVRPEDLIGRNIVTTHEDVDLSHLENRVVLVTGAAGSIGSELVRQLPDRKPTKLLLMDINESGLHDISIDLQSKYPSMIIEQLLVDVREYELLESVFETYKPQIVFHAAAYKHVPMLQIHPNAAVQTNIRGTYNLARLSRDYNVERFVLVSTDKAVNPSNVMGATKRLCEMVVRSIASQETNTLWTAVRFGNVLGSRGSVVPTFTRQLDRGGPLTVTHRDMTRYFMSISEAANLIIHAACLTSGSDTFLLKMGETVRIVDLAERMIRLRGMRPYEDIKIVFTGMRSGEKMHEQLYDGSIESAQLTKHPGIIRLEPYSLNYTPEMFLDWVSKFIDKKLTGENVLEELLYGMSPAESFAYKNSKDSDDDSDNENTVSPSLSDDDLDETHPTRNLMKTKVEEGSTSLSDDFLDETHPAEVLPEVQKQKELTKATKMMDSSIVTKSINVLDKSPVSIGNTDSFYVKYVKRVFDLVISSVVLIVFSPIILVTAVIVRTKLGSPIIFKQIRPGQDGIPFEVLKFRSMTDERDATGELLSDDIRLTQTGKLIRKLSLDEFPQLVNVLRGDISLVGPRPLLMEYLDLYTPEQARRNLIKPGITGLAQVNGRNSIAWEEKFEWDVKYVENASLFLDIQILVKTALRLVKPSGINYAGQATMPKFSGTIMPDPVTPVTSSSANTNEIIPLTLNNVTSIEEDDIDDTSPSLDTLLQEFKSLQEKELSRLIEAEEAEVIISGKKN